MSTFIVATDFSSASAAALDASLPLLKDHQKHKVILLHVWQKTEPKDSANIPSDEIIKQSAIQRLTELKQHALEKGLVTVTLLLEGEPAEIIIQAAIKNQAEMVIIGSSQETPVLKLLLGSTALKVLRNASTPTLVIPAGIESLHNFKRITYASDYHPGDIAIVKQLLNTFGAFHPQINILHISTDAISADQEIELMKTFQKHLSEQVSYNNLSFQLMHGDSLIEQLRSFIDLQAADLLVISTHSGKLFELMHQNGIGSSIIEDAAIPLLAFHFREHFAPKIF